MKRFVLIVAMLLALPLSAHAWWSQDWTGRKKITLDTKAAGVSTDVVSVPVLLRLSSGTFDFLAGKEDGSDIRFLAEDDKTELPFHIERYDSVNELAFIWVQVPLLAANNSSQHVWLYYGNTEADAPKKGPDKFDANQLVVYHFGEAQGMPQDASGNGNHATASGALPLPTGLIGAAVRLSGNGGVVLGGVALQAATGLTVSAWINPDKMDGEVFAMGGVSAQLVGGIPQMRLGGTVVKSTTPLPIGAWSHIAITAGPQYVLYVNGVAVANAPGALMPVSNISVGATFSGQLDELQVSSVVRPVGWILAQVQSQGEAGMLVKQGEEQTTDTSAEPNYFAATMKNLTVDGWVVVIICVVMFFVAIWIMYSKVVLLMRMEKTNLRFNAEFGEMTRALRDIGNSSVVHAGKLDELANKAAEYGPSSLHRIFKVGVLELKSRFPKGVRVEELPTISAQAMSAVRASLDAQLTRERHGLEKGMVLLTIAISGGPFLGLLGTVVGVMITFAAIAAAGDVNVNAIAPGIAAALVATVAGLGVAIPALFGYNYLMTKIKGVSADMNIFVDEFVTKMAENYGS